jgi:hypothetical protein
LTVQEQALVALATLLDSAGLAYMVIGGMANLVWGEPRATLDIDVTIWVDERDIPDVVAKLTRELEVLVPDAVEFILRTRVLPLRAAGGVRVDLLFGLLSFEQQAIARAKPVQVGGATIRFCTAEDLILHKIISSRTKDLADARGVVLRQRGALELSYLELRIAELASMLDQPQIAEHWQAWKIEAGL